MKYCKSCVYPFVTVNLEISEEGICSSCKAFEVAESASPEFWAKREEHFSRIIEESQKNNKSNYDCLIPVSGGKDSYYQTHMIVEKYGLIPLLMTYHGNNFIE